MGADGLVVAVTGPTGEIGLPFLERLEATPEVAEVRGMARRPFDPRSRGWRKTRYVRGDVLDPGTVEGLVTGADVVVHLAFAIFGSRTRTRAVNLAGSRNVFAAAAGIGARLVYTSSVAAYGFHRDNPQPLTEDVPARGSTQLYYSAQKAELEQALARIVDDTGVEAWVFRPSIVGGPDSPALVANIPYAAAGALLRGPLRGLRGRVPGSRPVLADPGTPMQLVHAEDVAKALVAGVLGRGGPGAYNLAAPGVFTMTDLARALGWHSVPVPGVGVDVTAELLDLAPALPAQLSWIHAARVPVVMDTTRARRRLGWRPHHDVHETLAATVDGAVAAGLVDHTGRHPMG